MLEKPAQTSRPIHDLFVRRWSTRAFDPKRPVSRDQLIALLEAGRWAPSCNGDEPWRYLIWDRSRDPEGLQKAFDCLSENNREVGQERAAADAVLRGLEFRGHRQAQSLDAARHRRGERLMALQAVALGLADHQMGGFDAEKARAAFDIPAEYMPMAMIAVGYQAAPDGTRRRDEKEGADPAWAQTARRTLFRGRVGQAGRVATGVTSDE